MCRLYLDPPAGTVLFSVDEKTAMHARSRKRPTRPIRPAMNVTTGTIHPKIIKKNDSDTFIEFLTELAQTIDPTKKIHLILGNGSSHTSTKTRTWLREHPRFTVTYTPTHASWLNMVEIFFSILTRRMLRRGDFASRDDLIQKIITFIQTYNSTAKPFRWTYDANQLPLTSTFTASAEEPGCRTLRRVPGLDATEPGWRGIGRGRGGGPESREHRPPGAPSPRATAEPRSARRYSPRESR